MKSIVEAADWSPLLIIIMACVKYIMSSNIRPIPSRKNLRLSEYDYSQPGGYFVTILTWQRCAYFGNVDKEQIHWSPFGEIAANLWVEIPHHYPLVELDQWVVMPNHVHGIIIIHDHPVGARHAV